ncbi:MAG TPA: AgmX/PglI C-terminal domain-containing protein [Polyangiaceae bacterium]|nr:AgmX/PglI C-terminal domain-containing protein [Polyangiaceae bacterium]
MRVARLFRSSIFVAVLATSACGGSPPPPAASPEPTPASDAAASPAPNATAKPAGDEEGWAGENTAKSAPSDVPAGDKPANDEPASTGGKGPETRTMDVIRKLVMDNRKAARKCYEDARKDLKDLQGNVVIHFVLDPEGKVKSADLNQERSTLKSPAVVNCVIDVIKGIQFPKSSRAMETSTNYPFNFTP